MSNFMLIYPYPSKSRGCLLKANGIVAGGKSEHPFGYDRRKWVMDNTHRIASKSCSIY